jgi:hypothetical protein
MTVDVEQRRAVALGADDVAVEEFVVEGPGGHVLPARRVGFARPEPKIIA